MLRMLLNSDQICSPQNSPPSPEIRYWGRKSDFIEEISANQSDVRLMSSKNHFPSSVQAGNFKRVREVDGGGGGGEELATAATRA